jgi:HSP20 family molecular chaperone IbpA
MNAQTGMQTRQRGMQTRQQETPEKFEDRPVILPPVDVFENDEEVLLIADLPDVEKDDLHIDYEKGQLTIGGHRREPEGKQRVVTEFRSGDYRRTFIVPQGIDANRIAAELKDGVLTVHMPKQESAKPKQIKVKAA